MNKSKVMQENDLKKLKNELETYPNNVEFVRLPVANKDMLKLLEISGAYYKKNAVLFAVEFTLNNFKKEDEKKDE